MAAPYPIELRTRIIEQTESGMKIIEASRLYKVHRETIGNWKKKKEETGSYEAKKGYQKGHSHKIIDKKGFRVFIDKNNDKSCRELASLWRDINNKEISTSSIYNGIKSIGYSNKKNFLSSKKRCWEAR